MALSRMLFLFVGLGAADGVAIDAMKHDIQQITPQKFDGIIGKFRDTAVSSLWFFKDTSGDKKFLDAYNAVAKDLKGMAKICAIDCNDHPSFCEKNDIKETPTVMIYPINPMPAFKFEGKMETKAISAKVARFIPDYTVALKDKAAADAFLTTEVSKPKVVLFSNKKSPPTILKALSSETVFRRTAKFGFVTEADAEVVKRFKITKFPSIVMQVPNSQKMETYKEEMSFTAIAEWVNRFSESGSGTDLKAPGGGAEQSAEEAKPWLVQEVPELTAKSHKDVCFKGEGLCVIYLTEGPAKQDEIDMLTDLSKQFTSQLSDRGARMKWMWMDLAVETEFRTLFSPPRMPSAVVFNPHKRLRFTPMDHGEDSELKGDKTALTNLMDKVLGGDARFKMVPGQKLPGWAHRDDKASPGRKEL